MGAAGSPSEQQEVPALIAQAESAAGRPVARVLLDSALPQLDHLFDYAVPHELQDVLRVGHRVRVPFRSQNRRSLGYVVAFADHSEFAGELQSISELVSPVPLLAPQIWRLARTLADRAGGSASDILRLAIPQRMVRVEKQHLWAPAGPIPACQGIGRDSDEHSIGARLCRGERLTLTAAHGPVRLQTGEWVGGWAAELASVAIDVFAQGRSVILAAPDYRDVDQLQDALKALGHDAVVRVDARQSGSARYAAHLRALDPAPRIVLGNRSAVYAPAHRLGAIMVWDDGDPLLAEPLSPYVHARDAALVRATLEHESNAADETPEPAPPGLLLAAHVRSIEVQRLIDIGYVASVSPTPSRRRVIPSDAVQSTAADYHRVPEFAARSIRDALAEGPVLVQVATPGYAPMAVCARCGERARCEGCAGPIAFAGKRRAACRWCGRSGGDWRCGGCGGSHLDQRGAGSERTAEQFAAQFPGVRIVLSDGAHPHERLDSRPALVVATRGAEPIAAGGYRAVVLLDAERLLSRETLRAGEDCLRWWHNAIALSAPGARCVLASGGGPVVQALVTGREDLWLQSELRDRRALRYPPVVRVASVTGGRPEVDRAVDRLSDLDGVDVLGPVPLPERSRPSGGATASGLVRAIVRFDYSQGGEVAKRLRAAVVADAVGGASTVAGRRPGRARPEALRLRFDDRGVFDSSDESGPPSQ